MTKRTRTSIALTVALLAVGQRVFAADVRTDGTRIFEERMTRLGELAREHEGVNERIRQSCVLDTRSGEVTGVLSPVCQALRDDASRLEAEVRDGIVRAKDGARRAGVYPGTVRTRIRRAGLESFSD